MLQITYDDLDTAFHDIKTGKIVGVIYMAENFTESFEERLNLGRSVSVEVVEFSQIKVWLDMSSKL